METETILTREGAWHGTHYELSIELGPRSDERLVDALRRLWEHPALQGPFADKEREPREQERADPSAFVLGDHPGRSYGVAALPDGGRVACGTWGWRREPGCVGSRDEEGTDFLNFFVPFGSLSRAWPQVRPYPFLGSNEEAAQHTEWRERLEALLADIGRHLFATVPFRLAIVGHELECLDEEFERVWGWETAVPAERWNGILLPQHGELVWHPPTTRGGWVLMKTPGNPSSWAEIFSS